MTPTPSKPRIVYIMGRGHSGSTVLDALLGSSAECESVGELASGLSRWPTEICSCGDKVEDCDFWKKFNVILETEFGLGARDAGHTLLKQAHPKYLLNTIFRRPDSFVWGPARTAHQAAIQALGAVSGKRIIVDSTKEFTRGLFVLLEDPRNEVVLLVRNPVGIAASYRHRLKQGSPLKVLRKELRIQEWQLPLVYAFVAGTWMIGWIISLAFTARFPRRVHWVKFEELCENPRPVLQGLGHRLDIDMGRVVDAVENNSEIDVGHNVGGNEMRFQGRFVFHRSSTSRRPRPLILRLTVLALSWPGMLALGYLRRGK